MQRENRMEVTRDMKIDTLKARISCSDYVVDADAVAEAIVRRLLSARAETPSADGPSFAGPPLEAA
jgi:hypothetical protein